jgi:nucleoside-diphosphate-sugar epimerase
MHVLVIGGTRFVGYLLVWRLLAAGHRVTIFNRGTRPDPFGSRVERLHADRTSAEFGRLLRGRRFDAVVDFAAFQGHEVLQVVDVLGDGAVGHYVLISTGQVYLVRQDCPTPATETDYNGPLIAEPADRFDHEDWLYGIGKRNAEDVLADAWAAEGFPSTRLRIPMVNGERDHFRRIESYLWRILDGGPILLPDGGKTRCRHVYGFAVAQAISNLLGNAGTFGQAYNLCQDEEPTLAELVTLLAAEVGAPARLLDVSTEQLEAHGLRPIQVSPFSDRWMSRLDPTRAKVELGFEHEPLERYLNKIVCSFLSHVPAEPPENYAHRPLELELAATLPPCR